MEMNFVPGINLKVMILDYDYCDNASLALNLLCDWRLVHTKLNCTLLRFTLQHLVAHSISLPYFSESLFSFVPFL